MCEICSVDFFGHSSSNLLHHDAIAQLGDAIARLGDAIARLGDASIDSLTKIGWLSCQKKWTAPTGLAF